MWARITDWLSRTYYHIGLSIPDPGEFSSGVLGLIAAVATFVKNLSGCETTGDLLSLLTTESRLFKRFGQLWDTLMGMFRLHFKASAPDSKITHAGELLSYRSNTFGDYTETAAIKKEISKFDADYTALSEQYRDSGSLSPIGGDLRPVSPEDISVHQPQHPPQQQQQHRTYSKEFSKLDDETGLYTSRLRSVLGGLLEGEINSDLMLSLDFSVFKNYLSHLMSFVTKIAAWVLTTVGTAFSRAFEMISDVFASFLSPGNAASRQVMDLIMPVSVYVGSISAKVSSRLDSSAKIAAEYAAKSMAFVVGKLLRFCAKIAQTEELVDFLEWEPFKEISQKIRIQANRSKFPAVPPSDSFHFFMWIVSIIREKNAAVDLLEPWKESVLGAVESWLDSSATWQAQGSEQFEDFRDLTYWLEFSKVKATHVYFLQAIDEQLLQRVQSVYGWVACGVGWVADAGGNLVNGSKVVKSYTLDVVDNCLDISGKISGFVEGTKKKSGVVLNAVTRVANMPANWWKSRSQFWKIIWKCVLWIWKIVKLPVAISASAYLLESFTGIHVPAEIIQMLSLFSVPFAYEFAATLQKLYYKLSANLAGYFDNFQTVLSASFVNQTLGNTQPDMAENLSMGPESESSGWVKTYDSLKETTFHTIGAYPDSSRRLLPLFKQYEEAVNRLSDKLGDWKGTGSLIPSYKFSKQLSRAVLETRYSGSFRKYFRIRDFAKLGEGFLDHLQSENIAELFVQVDRTKKRLVSELGAISSRQNESLPQHVQAKEQSGNIIKDALKGFTEAYSLEQAVKKLSGELKTEKDLSLIVKEYSAIREALASIRDRLIVSVTGGNFVSRGLDLIGLEPISDALVRNSSLKQATYDLEIFLNRKKKSRSEYINEVFGGKNIFIPDVEFQRFLNEISKISSRLEIVLGSISTNLDDYIRSRDTMKRNMSSMLNAQNALKDIRDKTASKITVKILDVNESTSRELEILKGRFLDILKTSSSQIKQQLEQMETIASDIDSTVREIASINQQLRVSYLKKEFSSIGLVDIMCYMASAASTFSAIYYLGSSVVRSCANASTLGAIVNNEPQVNGNPGPITDYLSDVFLPFAPFFAPRNRRNSPEAWNDLFVETIHGPPKKQPLNASYPIGEAPWSIKKICCTPGSNIPVSLSVESRELIPIIPSCFPSDQLQAACKTISVFNDPKKVYLGLFKKYSAKGSLFQQSIDRFLSSETSKVAITDFEKRHSLVKLEFGLHNDKDSTLQRSSALSHGHANSLIISMNTKHLALLEQVNRKCVTFFAQQSTQGIVEQLQDWRTYANGSELVTNFFQRLVSFVFLGGEEYRSQNRLGKLLSQVLTREVRDSYAIMSLPNDNSFHWKTLVNSVEKPQYSLTGSLVPRTTLFEKLGVALLCGFDMLLKQLAIEVYMLFTRTSAVPVEDLPVFYPMKDTLQHFGQDANPKVPAEDGLWRVFFEELFGFGFAVADYVGVSGITLDAILAGGSTFDSGVEWLATSLAWIAYRIPWASRLIEWIAFLGPAADSSSLLSNMTSISKICISTGVVIWLARWFVALAGMFNDAWITDGHISHALRVITNRVKSVEKTKNRTKFGSAVYWGFHIVNTVSKTTLTAVSFVYTLTTQLPFVGTVATIVVSMVKFMLGLSVPIYMISRLAKRVDIDRLLSQFSESIKNGIDKGYRSAFDHAYKLWYGETPPGTTDQTDENTGGANFDEGAFYGTDPPTPTPLNNEDQPPQDSGSATLTPTPSISPSKNEERPPNNGGSATLTPTPAQDKNQPSKNSGSATSTPAPPQNKDQPPENTGPSRTATLTPTPTVTPFRSAPVNNPGDQPGNAYTYRPSYNKGSTGAEFSADKTAASFARFTELLLDQKADVGNTISLTMWNNVSRYWKSTGSHIMDNGLSLDEIAQLFQAEGGIAQSVSKSWSTAVNYVLLMHPFRELEKLTGNRLLESLEAMKLAQTEGSQDFSQLRDIIIKLNKEFKSEFVSESALKNRVISKFEKPYDFKYSNEIVKAFDQILSKTQRIGATMRKRTRRKPRHRRSQVKLINVDISWSSISSDKSVPTSYEVFRNCLDIKTMLFSLLVDDEPYSKVAVFSAFSVPVFCFPDAIDHLSSASAISNLAGPDGTPLVENMLPDIHLRTCLRLLTSDLENADQTALEIARETLATTAQYLYNDVKMYLDAQFVEDIGMLFKISWYMIFRDAEKLAKYHRDWKLATGKPPTVSLELDPETLRERKQDIGRLLSIHAPDLVRGLQDSGIAPEISQKLGLHGSTFFTS